MKIKMSYIAAQITVTKYLCANCWEPLNYEFVDENIATVRCETEGCPCKGFVTKAHVEYMEAQAENEKIIVKRNLREYLDWLPKHRYLNNDQILKELGF